MNILLEETCPSCSDVPTEISDISDIPDACRECFIREFSPATIANFIGLAYVGKCSYFYFINKHAS